MEDSPKATVEPVRPEPETKISGLPEREIKAADPAVAPAVPPEPAQTKARDQRPEMIAGGVLNGKATTLPKPFYTKAARAAKAKGAVSVKIIIDEEGNVISTEALSGHPLLRPAAVAAARQAKFRPTRLSGHLIKVWGVIVYNFAP
jgi:TonB family protein